MGKLAAVAALTARACSNTLVRVTPDGVPSAGTTTALSDPTFEVVAPGSAIPMLRSRDGAIIAAESGAKVIWSCMTHLGQDLGGWLEGLAP